MLLSGDSLYNDLDYKNDDFNGSSSEEENDNENETRMLSKDNSDTGTDSDCVQDEELENQLNNCNDTFFNGTNFVFQSMRDLEELKRFFTQIF